MEARDKANAVARAAEKRKRRGSPVHPSQRPAWLPDFSGPYLNLPLDDNSEVTTDSEGGIPARDSLSPPRLVGNRGDMPGDHPHCLHCLSEAEAANISETARDVFTNKLYRYAPQF